MAVDQRDVAAWAARIRTHFPIAEQDIAEVAAFWFATSVGARVKDLRPHTSMSVVLCWLKAAPRGLTDPDWVELLMAIEADVASESSDEFAETLESRSFGEYVAHLASKKRPNTSFERTRGG